MTPQIPQPLTGGCSCDAVRYRIDGPVRTLYACHCSLCQRQSGSAFGLSLIVAAQDLVATGPLAHVTTARGGDTQRHFCSLCGTRLWHQSPDDGLVSIKAGTLDQRAWLDPVAHIWTESRQPWTVLPPDVPTFAQQPSMADLEALWARARPGPPKEPQERLRPGASRTTSKDYRG